VSEVILNFNLNKDEYIAATRIFYEQTHHLKKDSIIAIITLIGGFLLTNWDKLIGIGSIVIATAFLVIVLILLFIVPYQQYKRNPALKEECVLSFDDNGVTYKTKDVDSKIAWSIYKRMMETKFFYLLIYAKREGFTIIPKRVFNSSDQENEFKKIVIENLPKVGLA
jgi:hypothetical protein